MALVGAAAYDCEYQLLTRLSRETGPTVARSSGVPWRVVMIAIQRSPRPPSLDVIGCSRRRAGYQPVDVRRCLSALLSFKVMRLRIR
jgi:hypothetical protein